MRSLHQPQQCCTASQHRWHRPAVAHTRSASQHRWHRPAVAHTRSAPSRQSVTASAAKINVNITQPFPDVDPAPLQSVTVFELPKTARPLQSVLDAQAAAEAAQRQLLATGPLAEAAAAGNELVTNMLETYSTAQRLYHKAFLPFLERHPQYIDSPAGMAYEICRDILGLAGVGAMQPGGLITAAELGSVLQEAASAAIANGQQADAIVADCLLTLAELNAEGNWHVLPDLLTMLTSEWLAPRQDSSDSNKGWLSGPGAAADRLAVKTVDNQASALAREVVVDLMLYTSTTPDKPSSMAEGSAQQVTPGTLLSLSVLGNSNGQLVADLLGGVLATLPADDLQEVFAAELDINSWNSFVHTYPFKTSEVGLTVGALINELRVAIYSAGFSLIAQKTIMEHLAGSRPLDDWEPLREANRAYLEDTAFEKRQGGWNAAHALLLRIPPGSSAATARPEATADALHALDKLTHKRDVTPAGVIQQATAVQWLGAHCAKKGQTKEWDNILALDCSLCAGMYTELHLNNAVKPFDDTYGGFAHLLYWFEVERMALQLTGGQVGETAVSAARSIIDSVPHSVILARVALFCLDYLATRPAGSQFRYDRDKLVSLRLRAEVLARGSTQLAAGIQALRGGLPAKMLSQVASPYAVNAGGTARSVQQAADTLHQQLLQPNKQPSSADIVQLWSAAGSLDAEPRPFDSELISGLQRILTAGLGLDLSQSNTPLWFAAALPQLQLAEQARDSPVLADILAGSGLLEEEYLRPYAEFMAAKRATATALVQAVCRAGWCIQSSAVQAIAASGILSKANSPLSSLRGSLWALSSCIAGLDQRMNSTAASGKDPAAEPARILVALCSPLARAIRAAHQDDRLATDMPPAYHWLHTLAAALSQPSQAYISSLRISHVVQQIISESGGSFGKLEPAMQAIVQAAAMSVVQCPVVKANSAPVVGLLPVVPLLTAQGYSQVLDQLLTEVPAEQLPSTLPTAWSAAVAAATDLQLAVTPAFGQQRPNVPFLLRQVRRVWRTVSSQPQLALAVLQPVISAAGRLLLQHGTAGDAGAEASLQAGAQLLDAVCSLLASSSSQGPLPFAGVQQPAMEGVLTLVQQHPELPRLQNLQNAVCAAVCAEVTAGSGSILKAAELVAASGQQLSKAQLYWAAVEGAAAAMGQQQAAAANTRTEPELLLLYWSTAVLSAADAPPSSSAASVVVAAMAADAASGGDLTQQLLAAQQPLPTAVLGALLQAAESTDARSAVLPLLLSHALQTKRVQLLPADLVPQLLQSALAATVAPAAVLSFADCMQLLDLTLQQDRTAAVGAETAQLLLEAASSSTANRQQLKALIQQHSGSPAVSVLLCSMLQAACKSGVTEHSWQLFRLSQQCSQPSQQQLQACSDLIVQQRSVTARECTATAAGRIVSVWQHCCAAAGSSSAAVLQLNITAQQAVASALNASGQSEQALQLAQDIPALLPYLASLWQQQQVQREEPLETEVLLQALQMCTAAGSQQAAEAADTLTGLLLQQDASGTWQDGDLPVQLMQLLCTHGKAATVLQLLPACLAGAGSGSAAATAIAAAAGAVAKSGDTQQQAELLQLLATGATQGAVQDALSQALGQPAPAAVGLLLGALRDSSPEQGLGQLLTPNQLQQLSALVCSRAERKGSSSSSLETLPTLRQLAEDCLSAHQLTGGVAARLLNALCRQHSELQPTAAAGHLGEGASPAHNSTEGQGLATDIEGNTSAVKQLVQLVADLCYSQTSGSSSSLPNNDFDALEASSAEWASALSPEAAAAALFAAWVHRSQGSGPAVPLLCLELYQRAKPTGDSLVFELGLLAAAAAAQHTSNWDRGEGIIAAAAKAQQQAAGSRHAQWIPSWSAAHPALMSVLVHTKGVDAVAKLLLSEHEGSQAKQQGAAAGRKGKAGAVTTNTRRDVAATPTLLSLSAVNSFLSAAVAVAVSYQQDGSDEEAGSAARAALQTAGELFKPQLVAVSMGTSGAGLLTPGTADMLLDGTSWGCLAQLYGLLGDWQQLRNIVLAAARQQLPGVGPDGVQDVLAGAAAALNAAGRHVAAVQLLDALIAAGITDVSHPQLAQQMMDAFDRSTEVEQELANCLAAGDEAIYEGLPDVAAAAGGLRSDAVPAVRLVVHDAAEALTQLTSNLRRW